MTTQKIYYVYRLSDGEFLGYIVGTSTEDASVKAATMAGIPAAELRIEDTGKTRPKCCPRR